MIPTRWPGCFKAISANAQLLRNNVGIAYPAVDENCISDVLLPVSGDQLDVLAASAHDVAVVRSKLRETESNLASRVNEAISVWLSR